MNKKNLLGGLLAGAILIAGVVWFFVGQGGRDPAVPTAEAPRGADATGRATEERDMNLPAHP